MCINLSLYKYLVSTVLIILFTASCTSSVNIKPLTVNQNGFGETDIEHRIIAKADNLHQQLKNKGMIYRNLDANAYVDKVWKTIRPEALNSNIDVQFFILKDSSINAFALPNNQIYLNIGLLARITSEAQLAYVMAHELAHVIQRHGYKGTLERKSKIISAHISDLVLMGTGIAYLPAMASLAAFTREAETEADTYALDYIHKAGYNLNQVSMVFNQVLIDVRANQSMLGSIYNRHPNNKERVANTLSLIGNKYNFAKGKTNEKGYRDFRRGIVELNIQSQLRNGHYQLAVEGIKRELASLNGDINTLLYFEGEAYRLMADKPSIAAREEALLKGVDLDDALIQEFHDRSADNYDLANEMYQLALSMKNTSPVPYKGLGLVAYAERDYVQAVLNLERYLAINSEAMDKRYIKGIIRKIHNEKN